MSDLELIDAVAHVTGEDSHEIRRRGFMLVGPDDAGPDRCRPHAARPPTGASSSRSTFDRDIVQASPQELPAIDIHSL